MCNYILLSQKMHTNIYYLIILNCWHKYVIAASAIFSFINILTHKIYKTPM